MKLGVQMTTTGVLRTRAYRWLRAGALPLFAFLTFSATVAEPQSPQISFEKTQSRSLAVPQDQVRSKPGTPEKTIAAPSQTRTIFSQRESLPAAGPKNIVLAAATTSRDPPLQIALVDTAARILRNISPTQAQAGAAGATITLTGENFVGGAIAFVGNSALATTWISPTTLSAQIPARLLTSPGTFDVRVLSPSPGGGYSTSLYFSVIGAMTLPLLDGISPTTVAADGQGKTFDLTGSGFFAPVSVVVGAQEFAATSSMPTVAQVTLPGSLFGAAGSLSMAVKTVAGTSNSRSITITSSAPTLTSLSPSYLSASGQIQSLTLNGTNFVAPMKVRFDGTVIDVTPASATQVVVLIPGSLLMQARTVAVSVETPSGMSGALMLPIQTAPMDPYLYASAPATLLALGQAVSITLSGQNFVTGAQVLLGTAPNVSTLTASFVNSQQLTVTIPASSTMAASTLTLRVKNPDGVTSNEYSLPVTTPDLLISATAPTLGPIGSMVTIYGTGFSANPADNVVTFGGNAGATVLTATTTQLTVTVPTGAMTGQIRVAIGARNTLSPPFTVGQTPGQDFAFGANSAEVVLYQGSSTSVDVQLNNAGTESYAGLAKLSVTGAPTGVTATPTRPYLSNGQNAAIVIAASDTAATGIATLTVTATAPETNKTTTIRIDVRSKASVTGVKGRFIDTKGMGVGGVLVRHLNTQVQSDSAGNFLLVGLPQGEVTLRFDATPAHPLYPIWPYTATVENGKILTIPDWTINPPPADEKFVTINNMAAAHSITDNRFPGVEIVLPQGASITGWDGVKKTRIAVEKIDADRAPAPPPPIPTRTLYQLYFGTPMGGVPSQPIPVNLPNDQGYEPGEQAEIWFFDGSPMGGDGTWKLAGIGTVSPDGTKVIMNPGQGIPRFCGVCGLTCLKGKVANKIKKYIKALTSGASNTSATTPNRAQKPTTNSDPAADKSHPSCEKQLNPISLSKGNCSETENDMAVEGLMPIDVAREFNDIDAFNKIAGTAGSFGLGWVNSYDVVFLPFDGPQKRLVMPGNIAINFIQQTDGSYMAVDSPALAGAKFVQPDSTTWELRFVQGATWRFKGFAGINGRLRGAPPFFKTEVLDRDGNSLQIVRNSVGRMTAIGAGNRVLTMTYGANGFVSKVTDPMGQFVQYSYTATDRIDTVTHIDGKSTKYTYVDDTEFPVYPACPAETGGVRIKTIRYPGRTGVTENFYGPAHRVLRQMRADGVESKLRYNVVGACVTNVSNPGAICTGPACPTVDSWENFQAGWRIVGGQVISTEMVNSLGKSIVQRYDAEGRALEVTDQLGQTDHYFRDPVTSNVVRTVDAQGRENRFAYDSNGNVTGAVDAIGNLTEIGYNGFSKPTNVIRRLANNTPINSSATYDPVTGRLTSSTDPLGNTTSFSYTMRGQLRTVIDARGKITTFDYNTDGDLIKVTDPLGNFATFEYDLNGRRIKATDPLGFSTSFAYNTASQLQKTTDALLGETSLAYDGKRNLASVTNARGNLIESYQYDDRDRVTQTTDALGRNTGYLYDAVGLVRSITDRANRTFTFTRDEKNRLITSAFPDGSQNVLQYDAFGRLAKLSGQESTHTYRYDALDRMVEQTTTANGRTDTIAYQYDTLDRMIKRTVNGADVTDYFYDNASRLTKISYRGTDTLYAYDVASRLAVKTLPNGIKLEYTYDDANRVTAIAYKKTDNSLIEQITYLYDARGSRTRRTTLNTYPEVRETPFVATYDAADRMSSITLKGTGVGGVDEAFSLAYDNIGNLTEKRKADNSDVTTYGWNGKSQLVTLTRTGTNALAVNFKYDALGRRNERNINGDVTRFVYDGDQAILEIRPTETASILTGLDIDEAIARYTNGLARFYLADALNSTISLMDANEGIRTQIGFSAFGESSTTGEATTNSNEYTGRENDRSGLYYYRARYYDPTLKRFISEDPIGLEAGPNLYSYVNGDPVSFSDPAGLLCTYSQKWHYITCTDENGKLYYGSVGYSGRGEGRNNPAAQGKEYVGPIPRGRWQVTTEWHQYQKKGLTVRLKPLKGNQCFDTKRNCDTFLIHANNWKTNDASEGCMILPSDRTKIPVGEIIEVVE